MKIKVNEKILNYENKPLKVSQGSEDDLTWQVVIFTALNNFAQDEKPTAEVKAQCYQITKKVYDSNEPDLTVGERSLIIERIEKIGDIEKRIISIAIII